jgi:hypothetical protein
MITTLQGPTINNINNSELNSIRAMPQKDITSDNESSFKMSRTIYSRTFPNTVINTPITHTNYIWQARRNVQQITSIPNGVTSNYMNGKKWYGNRDASQVTINRRTNQVGVGSLNSAGNLVGFTTNTDINTTKDALRRVRASGAVAPAKKGANRNNAPVPTFSPVIENNPNLKKIFGIKQPYLFH